MFREQRFQTVSGNQANPVPGEALPVPPFVGPDRPVSPDGLGRLGSGEHDVVGVAIRHGAVPQIVLGGVDVVVAQRHLHPVEMRWLRLDADQANRQAALPAQHRRRDHPAAPPRAEFGHAESAPRRQNCREQRDPLEIFFVDGRMLDVDLAPIVKALRLTGQQPVADVHAVKPALESRLGPPVVMAELVEDTVRRHLSPMIYPSSGIADVSRDRISPLTPDEERHD